MLSVVHRTSVRSWTRHDFGWRHAHAPVRRATRASSLMAGVPAAGGRSYADAIAALNSLQTPAKELAEQKRTGARDLVKSVPHMRGYAERIGITDAQLDAMVAVHVAGTKGKGSTCVMVDAILRGRGLKTGLYTSPHLLEARERIRIGSVPISRDDFARHFWECWDLLEQHPSTDPDAAHMPTYFRFLTLMAFRIFAAERVDVAVIEVGLGGRHDATNILQHPAVCGVTSLGLDHTAILGDTIGEIGYQKGGIFKAGVPAVTSPQPPDGMAALSLSAKEVGVPLLLAPPPEAYGDGMILPGVKGAHQLVNASLALQLVRLWDARDSGNAGGFTDGLAPGEVAELPAFVPDAATCAALSRVRWPGRSQKLDWGGFMLYIDGAHTSESCNACVEWFATESLADAGAAVAAGTVSDSDNVLRVLLFNCTGGRDSAELLGPIAALSPPTQIDVALFCPGGSTTSRRIPDQINLTVDDAGLPMRKSAEYQATWLALHSDSRKDSTSAPSSVYPTLEECFDRIRELQLERGGVPVHVLVTGSLHFVGAVMHFAGVDVS